MPRAEPALLLKHGSALCMLLLLTSPRACCSTIHPMHLASTQTELARAMCTEVSASHRRRRRTDTRRTDGGAAAAAAAGAAAAGGKTDCREIHIHGIRVRSTVTVRGIGIHCEQYVSTQRRWNRWRERSRSEHRCMSDVNTASVERGDAASIVYNENSSDSCLCPSYCNDSVCNCCDGHGHKADWSSS